jgi:hypothetical protein
MPTPFYTALVLSGAPLDSLNTNHVNMAVTFRQRAIEILTVHHNSHRTHPNRN